MSKQFDAGKRYQWQPTDKIIFTGSEFDTLNRALSMFVTGSVTNTTTILKLAEAFSVMQAKLAEYVNNGIFTEFVDPAPVKEDAEVVA